MSLSGAAEAIEIVGKLLRGPVRVLVDAHGEGVVAVRELLVVLADVSEIVFENAASHRLEKEKNCGDSMARLALCFLNLSQKQISFL